MRYYQDSSFTVQVYKVTCCLRDYCDLLFSTKATKLIPSRRGEVEGFRRGPAVPKLLAFDYTAEFPQSRRPRSGEAMSRRLLSSTCSVRGIISAVASQRALCTHSHGDSGTFCKGAQSLSMDHGFQDGCQ